jgi:hypothetical protein
MKMGTRGEMTGKWKVKMYYECKNQCFRDRTALDQFPGSGSAIES